MKREVTPNNPYGDDKVIDACSIFGMMDQSGRRFSGRDITRAIANMHDRGNGLGGGFAAYGIYPDHADDYALHIMYLTRSAKSEVETLLFDKFHVLGAEEVPTRETPGITGAPLVWRYFTQPKRECRAPQQSDEDFVVEQVMKINTASGDAFVFSSGKNMGVFKGVGYPEEISHFFRLEDYEGYLWTAHGRFPTNSRGWWGGAHPFSLLDWTVVHNGEISSYGINRRYLEMFGYVCTMHTDTEVLAYAVDLLARKHELPIEAVADVLAPPLWVQIDRMPAKEKAFHQTLRQVYSSLLMNGPFTIIIAHQREMIGLTDRVRLRPLTVGVKGEVLFLSSEEASIRLICPDLDRAWIPVGGEPIVARLKGREGERAPDREAVVA